MNQTLKLLNKEETKIYNSLSSLYANYRHFFYDEDYYDYNSEKAIKKNQEKEWIAIPYNGGIIQTLMRIKKSFPQHKTFLDVGCGKGNILGIAYSLYFRVFGIEFRKEYEKYLKNNYDYYLGRAEEYKDYDNHDIIFFYQIMKDPILLKKLVAKIAKKMKVGALIYVVGTLPPTSFKRIWNDLYMKIKI